MQKAFEEPLSEDEVEEVQPIQTAEPGEVTMGLKVELDLSLEMNRMWLQRIKLWEFANLPWGQWMSNPDSYS